MAENTDGTSGDINKLDEEQKFSEKPFSTVKLEVASDAAPEQVFVNMNDEQRTESTPSQGLVDHSVLYPHLTQKQQQPKHVKEFMLRKFFAIRRGAFDHAVEDIRQYLKETVDGKFKSAWLMAEIDHWDHEKERIIILTDTQMVVIKYNFVATRVEDCRRIQLHMIDKVQGGRFQYPEKTMMMPRAYQTGIRISWNKKEVLTRWQRFSPFFNTPSYVTFTQHKAGFHIDEADLPSFMKYEDFKKDLVEVTQQSGAVFEVAAEPLFVEVYVGAMSVIHNSSDLGYSKDRGKVSF